MPRNDGGALPGEEVGAPQEIQFAGGGVVFARLDQAGIVFERQMLNLYGGGFRFDPGYTAEAEEAAEKAFRGALTPAQRATWAGRQWLVLRSNLGHWWRIRGTGYSGNVDLLSAEDGVPLVAYCAHPDGMMPFAGHWLSQLLTLTHDEARFTQVAVCHFGYPLPDRFRVPSNLKGILPASVPWVYR